jgi:hypothetical protein
VSAIVARMLRNQGEAAANANQGALLQRASNKSTAFRK